MGWPVVASVGRRRGPRKAAATTASATSAEHLVESGNSQARRVLRNVVAHRRSAHRSATAQSTGRPGQLHMQSPPPAQRRIARLASIVEGLRRTRARPAPPTYTNARHRRPHAPEHSAIDPSSSSRSRNDPANQFGTIGHLGPLRRLARPAHSIMPVGQVSVGASSSGSASILSPQQTPALRQRTKPAPEELGTQFRVETQPHQPLLSIQQQQQQQQQQQLHLQPELAIQQNQNYLHRQQPQPAFKLEAQHNPDQLEAEALANESDIIKARSHCHPWRWNLADKSNECLVSDDGLEVCFHPECSESTAAIRADQPLRRDGNYYYWEIKVLDKTYGTSVMFGLCTKDQPLHINDYCHLIGLDQSGWSLSHKGLIWHNGKIANYSKPFPANQPVTVGLLFETIRGELSYIIDGRNLGVAFTGLNNVPGELYPVVGSTAKCTRMRLMGSWCGYLSLMERCCYTIINNTRNPIKLIDYLIEQRVPKHLCLYLADSMQLDKRNNNKNNSDAQSDKRRQEYLTNNTTASHMYNRNQRQTNQQQQQPQQQLRQPSNHVAQPFYEIFF